MGIPVLILGESGTGKTTSLRNFKAGELAVVNVVGKPLPFRGDFEMLSKTTDASKIQKFMKNATAKSIVIDDCQYIMSFQYMRRIKENGWEKFNDLQSDFFNIIDSVGDLPDDVIVYFLSHLETKDDGRQKIKTIGKLLDEKITIEGMFTTVLKTHVSDGKYYFLTQNSGSDTVKSPLGMFTDFAIDNDLKYVDEKIRNYYRLGEYKSDEEIAEADEKAARPEIEKASNGRVKRSKSVEQETPARKSRAKKEEKEEQKEEFEVNSEEIPADSELPFYMSDEERDADLKAKEEAAEATQEEAPAEKAEAPVKRTRKRRD